MKRLNSYPDELAHLLDKDLDRSQSLSSSSQHHRRLKLPGRNSSRAEQQARDRDKRVEYDVIDERTSRRFEKRTTTTTDHEESNGRKYHHDSDDRGSRKRNEHESSVDDEGFRGLRKRFEDGFERRKGFGFERHRERDGDDRGGIMVSSSNSSLLGSPRGLYEREREREREKEKERIRRSSESFCGIRREIPKGFRSERERSRRDDSVSVNVNVTSWRTFGSRSKRDGGNEETRSSGGVEKAERSCSRGGGGGDGSSRDSLRSPKGVKDLRSPTWSKESRDSVGESKVKSLKKNEGGEGGVESGGSSNAADIEEGELQPEARLEKEPEPVSKLEAEHVQDENGLPEPVVISAVKLEVAEKSCQKMESDLSTKVALHEEDIDAGKEIHHVLESVEKDVIREAVVIADEASGANAAQLSDAEDNVDGHDQESLKKDLPSGSAPIHSKPENQDNVEVGDLSKVASLALSQEMKLVDGVDLEFQADNVNMPESSRVVLENDQKELELPVNILKDKGKGVVVCSPEDTSFRGIDAMIQAEFIPRGDDDGMEGPSTRGFDLFSTCVGTKGNQANQSETKHEKRTLEPLDLSLALPSVSLHVPASVDAAPPNSPPQGRSVQSLATTYFAGSDCFTTSVSFSGSQFMHNPSCSLTHNSMDCDFEQSVKSRPLFKNFDWQAHSASDLKQNEVPVFPKVLPNGNASLHPTTPSQVVYTGQPVTGQPVVPFALDRSGSFKRQLSIIKPRHSSDMRSPTQSAGPYDTRSESGRDKRWAVGNDSGSRLFRSSSQKDMQPTAAREIDFFDRILMLLVSEPIHAMSCRVREMSEQAIACLKEHTREMIEREDRGRKLHALQEVLKNRSDLILESLSKAHHVQLEILVALKTGLADYLQRVDSISLVDLSEIFLYLKCRNLNCGSALPVDDCDCKFCSRKEGFCSSCMCLVCLKFDTASNTCSWVGCDACSHWCHTDCGLQKSYIRNGTCVATSQGSSKMQFYCVACNHPSEMYGFVTDVFKVCASEWSAETMLKELEYVQRMFSGSTDVRGKLLHDLVSQLLLTLQNGSNVAEVPRQIMAFLAESDSKFINASGSPRSHPHALEKNKADVGNNSVGLDAEALGFRSLSMKNTSMTESTRAPALNTEGTSGGKSIWDLDERRVSKINKPVTATSGSRGAWDAGPSIVGKNIPMMDDLEGIVKIKLAEADMFQTRADNARGEVEGLRAIAVAKHQKAEEEYTTRIMKLRLGEAEERRGQKLEELQILERSHREYSNMKSRMEADIKLLLLKMEATKRNMRT
ncbi:OBERON 4-like protein [Drosera capensis]